MVLQPNVAYGIAMLGALAVYLELARPGMYIPGLAGAALLAWGGYSLSHFDVGYAAVGLVLLGLLVLLTETIWNTRFMSAIFGGLALAFGSARLLSSPPTLSGPLVWGLSVVFVCISFLLARSAREARENKRRDLAN